MVSAESVAVGAMAEVEYGEICSSIGVCTMVGRFCCGYCHFFL